MVILNLVGILLFLLGVDSSSTTSSASPMPNSYDALEGGSYPGNLFCASLMFIWKVAISCFPDYEQTIFNRKGDIFLVLLSLNLKCNCVIITMDAVSGRPKKNYFIFVMFFIFFLFLKDLLLNNFLFSLPFYANNSLSKFYISVLTHRSLNFFQLAPEYK